MIVNLKEPFYSYDRLVSDARELAKKYPDLIKLSIIGKTHDNRDIILLKLGYGNKYMISTAGVHGRESINPITIMAVIEHYARFYVNRNGQKRKVMNQLNQSAYHLTSEYDKMLFGNCIYELLQAYTLLFIPVLNPDGYTIALEGFDAIKDENLRKLCISKKLPYIEWKFNARGVDINRNFPSRLWKPKNINDYAASENETKALISVFHSYRTRGFLDLHSRGNQIYYYRREMPASYNERQKSIVRQLKTVTGYEPVPPDMEIDPGDTGGNTVHYYAEHFYKPAITIETVKEEASFPLDISYRVPVFQVLRLAITQFASLII